MNKNKEYDYNTKEITAKSKIKINSHSQDKNIEISSLKMIKNEDNNEKPTPQHYNTSKSISKFTKESLSFNKTKSFNNFSLKKENVKNKLTDSNLKENKIIREKSESNKNIYTSNKNTSNIYLKKSINR